jgi:hypothetical protein
MKTQSQTTKTASAPETRTPGTRNVPTHCSVPYRAEISAGVERWFVDELRQDGSVFMSRYFASREEAAHHSVIGKGNATYKLDSDQMQEVNQLIEEAQDDIEPVLFKLVAQRDELLAAGNRLENAVSDLLNEPRSIEIQHYAETALQQWTAITKADQH